MFSPHVRHYIFHTERMHCVLEYRQLYETSCICPELRTLEIRQMFAQMSKRTAKNLQFQKLEKFAYIYDEIYVKLEKLLAIFDGTNTTLVIKNTSFTHRPRRFKYEL